MSVLVTGVSSAAELSLIIEKETREVFRNWLSPPVARALVEAAERALPYAAHGACAACVNNAQHDALECAPAAAMRDLRAAIEAARTCLTHTLVTP